MLGVSPSTKFTAAGTLFRHLWPSDQGRGNMAYLSTLGNKMREPLCFSLDFDSDNIGEVSEDENTNWEWNWYLDCPI